MKYFIPFFFFCSLAFSQPDSPQDPLSSDSLEEDMVGTIAQPTHDLIKVVPPKTEKQQHPKKSLKNQLKKKPKTKMQKEKIKDKKNKKNKKNKKHKSKN